MRWSAEVRGLVPWLGSVDRVVVDGSAHDGARRGAADGRPDPPARRLEQVDGTPLPGTRDVARSRAAIAGEAVGIAQRALELGVEHAKTREQFGKPIGVYQAVSHQLANTYADVELARSLAYWAAWCVAEDDEQAPVAAAAAKAFATEAAVAACERVDPGARRHGLHVGAPAAPLLQARALARGLRRAAGASCARRLQTPLLGVTVRCLTTRRGPWTV